MILISKCRAAMKLENVQMSGRRLGAWGGSVAPNKPLLKSCPSPWAQITRDTSLGPVYSFCITVTYKREDAKCTFAN